MIKDKWSAIIMSWLIAHIYPDATSTSISTCILHSVCDTSMGSDIQIKYER